MKNKPEHESQHSTRFRKDRKGGKQNKKKKEEVKNKSFQDERYKQSANYKLILRRTIQKIIIMTYKIQKKGQGGREGKKKSKTVF